MAKRGQIGDIFLDVTPVPVRKYMVEVLKAAKKNYGKVVLPCAGRFTIAEAAVEAGWKPNQIFASDITLFSSILGFLCATPDDPRALDRLDIKFSGEFEILRQESNRAIDIAAATILAFKLSQLREDRHYDRIHREELIYSREDYLEQLRTALRGLASNIGGVSYEINDVTKITAAYALDPEAVLYLHPAGGYAKIFDTGGKVTWSNPQIPEFNAKRDMNGLYALTESAPALTFYFRGNKPEKPDLAVFATEQKVTRVEYLLCNRPDEARVMVKHRKETKINPAPIPNLPPDHEITESSTVQIIPTTRERALYYRDLFAHKLGVTRSENYYLLLIDGYLMGVYGMVFDKVMRGQSGTVCETFGFNIPSKRYPRMNRLLMMLIMCEDARQTYQNTQLSAALREIDYFQTTCIASVPEVKANRGLLEIRERYKREDGRYYINYGTPFKPWSFKQAIAKWVGDMQRQSKATGRALGV